MIIVHSENSLSALSATVVSTSIEQGGMISSNKCYIHTWASPLNRRIMEKKKTAWSGGG